MNQFSRDQHLLIEHLLQIHLNTVVQDAARARHGAQGVAERRDAVTPAVAAFVASAGDDAWARYREAEDAIIASQAMTGRHRIASTTQESFDRRVDEAVTAIDRNGQR